MGKSLHLRPADTLYQGRLLMRNSPGSKWVQVHVELVPDRMVRPAGENGGSEFIRLCCCVLKKLKNPQNSKQKFGFKLSRDQHTAEFMLETQENFCKW